MPYRSTKVTRLSMVQLELLNSHVDHSTDWRRITLLLSRGSLPHSSPSHEFSPRVNGLILGTKLSGRVLPELPIDLRLWLSGAVDLCKTFWLAVHSVDGSPDNSPGIDLSTQIELIIFSDFAARVDIFVLGNQCLRKK